MAFEGEGIKSESPLAGGTDPLPFEEKSDIGRAMRTTPNSDT